MCYFCSAQNVLVFVIFYQLIWLLRLMTTFYLIFRLNFKWLWCSHFNLVVCQFNLLYADVDYFTLLQIFSSPLERIFNLMGNRIIFWIVHWMYGLYSWRVWLAFFLVRLARYFTLILDKVCYGDELAVVSFNYIWLYSLVVGPFLNLNMLILLL